MEGDQLNVELDRFRETALTVDECFWLLYSVYMSPDTPMQRTIKEKLKKQIYFAQARESANRQ